MSREAVDWVRLRQRLRRAAAVAALPDDVSPERARAIMADRARALAQRPADTKPALTQVEILAFALGGERYAIEATYVREIARLPEVTPVPGTPEIIAGITSHRGEILCLIDLRRLFSVPATPLTDVSRMIVLGGRRAEFALLAHTADAMLPLPRADILPPEAGYGRAHLLGVTREAVVVLDGASLLRAPELYVR